MTNDITKKSKQLFGMVQSANSIAIIGHVHPDGDCVGSTLGLYNYLNDNYKGKNVVVYMEEGYTERAYLHATQGCGMGNRYYYPGGCG